MPPSKPVAVLACMDACLNVYGALGLREGDAHVIRTAGGVVTDDAIRSLLIWQDCSALARSSSSTTVTAAC
jgi:carbonic anhydrase